MASNDPSSAAFTGFGCTFNWAAWCAHTHADQSAQVIDWSSRINRRSTSTTPGLVCKTWNVKCTTKKIKVHHLNGHLVNFLRFGINRRKLERNRQPCNHFDNHQLSYKDIDIIIYQASDRGDGNKQCMLEKKKKQHQISMSLKRQLQLNSSGRRPHSHCHMRKWCVACERLFASVQL